MVTEQRKRLLKKKPAGSGLKTPPAKFNPRNSRSIPTDLEPSVDEDRKNLTRINSQAFDYGEVEQAKQRISEKLRDRPIEGRTGQVWYMYAVLSMTQPRIAEVLEITQGRVSQIVTKVREGIEKQTRDEICQERVEQLKSVANAVMPMALSGDTKSVQALLKILERESKLLGLDKPSQVFSDNKVSYQVLGIDPSDLT